MQLILYKDSANQMHKKEIARFLLPENTAFHHMEKAKRNERLSVSATLRLNLYLLAVYFTTLRALPLSYLNI